MLGKLIITLGLDELSNKIWRSDSEFPMTMLKRQPPNDVLNGTTSKLF